MGRPPTAPVVSSTRHPSVERVTRARAFQVEKVTPPNTREWKGHKRTCEPPYTCCWQRKSHLFKIKTQNPFWGLVPAAPFWVGGRSHIKSHRKHSTPNSEAIRSCVSQNTNTCSKTFRARRPYNTVAPAQTFFWRCSAAALALLRACSGPAMALPWHCPGETLGLLCRCSRAAQALLWLR